MNRKKSFENQRTLPAIYKKIISMIFISLCCAGSIYAETTGFRIILKPIPYVLMTDSIQYAINKCDLNGGGTVVFTKGTYLSGSIQLKSNITLQLEAGALLQGSDKYSDYRKDAFIFGKDLTNITIEGDGIIDGVDCYNPRGEEGFRGPHAIRFISCKNISIKGITIKNSANYALYFRYCIDVKVDNMIIRGGHDGLHTRFGKNFTITACDFRTGDDAFAGNDNQDIVVTNCKINTSCNGFRMGCYNFTVTHCRIWGPGEYAHKIEEQKKMPTAFVHFSPRDEHPKLLSGNWFIQDVTIDSVEYVYLYDYDNGLWQTGQAVTNITFDGVKAGNILKAFDITGDTARQFNLNILNSSFSFREGAVDTVKSVEGTVFSSPAFFNAQKFGKIELHGVTFNKTGNYPILNLNSGNGLQLNNVTFNTGNNSIPFAFKKIKDIKKKNVKLDSFVIPEDK
jgi:hypothetical protein